MIAWLPSAGGPLRVLECMAGHVLPALPCGTTFEGAIFAVVLRASRFSASTDHRSGRQLFMALPEAKAPCPHYALPNEPRQDTVRLADSYPFDTCGNVQISTDLSTDRAAGGPA